MKLKYKGILSQSASLSAVCAIVLLSACVDDFGSEGPQSQYVTLDVKAPADWSAGVNVDDTAPGSRCTSVDALSSDGDTPLYLHTVECDNPVSEPTSRGALKKAVERFSLSAICYVGGYPADESEITWTPDFAYDETYTVSGSSATGAVLQWPAGGKVRFFAFAPVAEDAAETPFTLSAKTAAGSPKITYTVPSEVTKQHDLMAACTDATTSAVSLDFKHILTAVKVVAAADMLPGTITSVEINGVYNAGTFTPTPSGASWTADTKTTGNYTVSRKVALAPSGDSSGYEPGSGDKSDEIVGDVDKSEIVGETGDLTLLVMPQTLPDGAKLTVHFTDSLTNTQRTLTASLKGKTWPAGKVVSYAISPSSIHIVPTVEFSKTPSDILPYSGVWHDAEIKAYAAVTQDGVKGSQYIELPRPEIEYSTDNGKNWTRAEFDTNPAGNSEPAESSQLSAIDFVTDLSRITSYKGTFVLGAQDDFTKLASTFSDRNTCLGTSDGPHNLLDDAKGESANCYMVDQPGYYCLPVVYGNAYNNELAYTLAAGATNGMKFYVDYKGNQITSQAPTVGLKDAQLAWQDAPDLIDDVRLLTDGAPTSDVKWVGFRVRKHSLTQGNALIVVRDDAGVIVWSWHIWVSQHKKEWMGADPKSHAHKVRSIYKDGTTFSFSGNEYYLTNCNLGYCDPHKGNDEREVKIRFMVDCSKITGSKTPMAVTKYNNGKTQYDCKFTQAEFKGSLAGDNTYYQWGRKDPMLGGIYNDKTPIYYKGTDYAELNMENKPTFNAYNDGTVSYDFTRNTPGTSLTSLGEETGVLIDYTIKYPYKFVMSKYDDQPNGGEKPRRYRNHWHKFVKESWQETQYLKSESEMFQMWNSQATKCGSAGNKADNEQPVTKSIYDPCPAGYHVPPANVLSGLAYQAGTGYGGHGRYEKVSVGGEEYTTSMSYDSGSHTWTVTYPGGKIEFPVTGMRNMAVRYKDLASVKIFNSPTRAGEVLSDPNGIDKVSLPAFRIITYLTSTSTSPDNSVYIYNIDARYEFDGVQGKPGAVSNLDWVLNNNVKDPSTESCVSSNNSYGLSVRPVLEN